VPTAKVEVQIADGTWVDVTADDLDPAYAPVKRRIRTEGGIEITSRGRGDEQSAVTPGRLSIQLNNQDGKYANRNPLSPYYGQLGRNAPIRVGVDPMADTFSRTVTDSWGTSSSGHPWTIVSGTASHFDVAGGAGTILAPTLLAQRVAVLPNSYGEVEVLARLSISSVAGDPVFGIVTNWQDSNNYKEFRLTTSGGDLLFANLHVNNVTDLVTFVNIPTIVAGTSYWLRVQSGKRDRARIWVDGTSEPQTWNLDAANMGTTLYLPWKGRVGVFVQSFSADATLTVDDVSVISYRYHGEVRSWPSRRGKSGKDASVPIEAVGLLNRLSSSGQTQLQSPMRREATKPSVQRYTAQYWPCEDESAATQIASAVPSAPAMTVTAPVNFASSSAVPGSKPFTVFGNGGKVFGVVPNTVDTTGKVFWRICLDIPDSPSTPDGTIVWYVSCTGGTIGRVVLVYLTTAGGAFEARALSAATDAVLESASLGGGFNGKTVYISLEMVQSGANVSFTSGQSVIAANGQSVTPTVSTDTWVGMTIGRCWHTSSPTGLLDGWGFCHLGVGNNQAFMFSMASALIGNWGETAGARAVRVAAEAGIPFQLLGDPADTTTMGVQIQGSALDVLRSCEAADAGILYESRNELGLSYRTRASMYNQDGPVLDYDARQLNVVDPVDDDQILWNDATVSRIGGSSARETVDTGPTSTQDPPVGVGRILAPDLDLAVGSDTQLPELTGWRLHIGSWDEQRFRTIGVQHAARALQADPDLRAQLAALDSGDVLAVDNPPPDLPPDRICQLVQGYTETIAEDGATALWSIDWTTTPAGPYDVAVVDGEARVDTDGSTLALPLTSSALTLSVEPDTSYLDTTTQSDYASTPDDASLDITGDIDVRVELRLNDWTNSGLAEKYVITGNQRSWAWHINPSDQIAFRWTTDGTTGTLLESFYTGPLPMLDGQRIALRVTMDVDNGAAGKTVTFYWAKSIAGPWTQLVSNTTAGTTSIFSSTAPLEVGRVLIGTAAAEGQFYKLEVYSGIAGAVRANPRFDEVETDDPFTDGAGRTWTAQGAAELVPVTYGGTWATLVDDAESPADFPVDIKVGGERITIGATGQVLPANPWMLADATGWIGVSATVARSTAVTLPGSGYGSLLITPDGVSASGGANAADPAVTVVASTQYLAFLWAYSPGGHSDLRPAVDWYTSGGVFISSSLGSAVSVPAATWTPLSAVYTSPGTAAGAKMRARHGGTPAASAIWYATALLLIPTSTYTGIPQTLTAVRRSVNGVVKAHSIGSSVTVADPAYPAL
jgi:hypothetical protein